MGSLQEARVPWQEPSQPTNRQPFAAWTERRSGVYEATAALHRSGQAIAPLEVCTEPLPETDTLTR